MKVKKRKAEEAQIHIRCIIDTIQWVQEYVDSIGFNSDKYVKNLDTCMDILKQMIDKGGVLWIKSQKQ